MRVNLHLPPIRSQSSTEPRYFLHLLFSPDQKLIGCQIAVIYTAEENARMLSDLGVPSTHILPSGAKNSTSKLLKLTSGKGFDVVVTDVAGDIKEQLVASLGRFVRFGKGSAPGNGRKQNMSITSIDFESMAHTRPSIIAE